MLPCRHVASPVPGGAVYFNADGGTIGSEPGRTDGTEADTVPVRDIDPGSGDSERR